MKYLISACLAGIPCRYDGKACPHPQAVKMLASGMALPFCPEVAGGLPTPRPPCEIIKHEGKRQVISRDGADFTHAYEAGAAAALWFMKDNGLTCAILKSGSPSCGLGTIHDGGFGGGMKAGNGLTAQLLSDQGMRVFTQEYLDTLQEVDTGQS